jgi:hypothetical protein
MDSEVSRRSLLAALAGLPMAYSLGPDGKEDPILALCREWHEANVTLNECCYRKQQLEKVVIARVGFPVVDVMRRGGIRRAASEYEIDRLIGKSRARDAERNRLKEELARQREAWDREALACGFTEADNLEEMAANRLDDIMRAVSTMPAQSLAGLLAKLTVASAIGKQEADDPDGHPWVFIDSALTDLQRLMRAA